MRAIFLLFDEKYLMNVVSSQKMRVFVQQTILE